MSIVLTTADTVACGHPSSVITTVGSPILTVGGGGVLTDGGVLGWKLTCAPPGGTTPPCATATVTDGRTTRLTVGGQPVLLDGLAGTTSSGGTLQVSFDASSPLRSA